MANATKFPTLKYFQWSRPDAPRPTLSAPLSAEETTAYFSSAPKDADGAVITSPFLFGVKRADGYVETIYAPNGANGASGLSATDLVRGIDLEGLDYTTRNETMDVDHLEGKEIFCNITGVMASILSAVLDGTVATGGTGLIVGTDADGTVTISRSTGAGTSVGWVRWNTSVDKAQFSDDGSVWVNFTDVSASVLAKVSAADTTPGYIQSKITAGDGLDEAIINPAGNEELGLSVDVTDIIDTSYGLTEDTNNIRINLDATPGLEFNSGALRAKIKSSGGITRDADGLSLTSSFGQSIPFVVAENVTAGNALALLPYEVEWRTQLTDANLALGDSNVRRKYSVKIIPKETSSTLTTMLFRAAEAVNGATALGDLTISIQADSAGAPLGTAITNGTANVISQVTQRTWTTAQSNRTATWATPPTLTAGTTYWIVWEVAATDATNYLNISVNSAHDENFVTFTRLTYNLDTTSWGGSVTNATPYFWFNNQPVLLGSGVVPTDANWGARTWNFIGFAKTTVAAESSVDVYTDYVPGLLSGLTPRRDYWLSETPGALTLTPPTAFATGSTEATSFGYKIGSAVSTSSFKIQLGTRRVVINELSTPLTATTARNYITWFHHDYIRVSASHVGGNNSTFSNGYVMAQGNQAGVAATYDNAAAGALGASVTESLVGDSAGSDDFVGAASSITDIGFTFTFTEAGTATVAATLDVTS